MKKNFKIDWSFFLIIEFLGSFETRKLKPQNKKLLDIGSGAGIHSEIFRKFGFDVVSIDKYSKNADINKTVRK